MFSYYSEGILTKQLTRIIEELYILNNNRIKNRLIKYNTNFKNNLDKTNNILKILLYKKNICPIVRIINALFEYLIKIRPNRTFSRRTIIPPNNWFSYYSERIITKHADYQRITIYFLFEEKK